MIDKKLVFFENKAATSTFDGQIDFGQAHPNTGSYDDPMYVVIVPTKPITGSGGSITYTIEDSDTSSGHAVVLSTKALSVAELAEPVIIPMPIKHKQNVKLKGTVSATISGGTVTAYVTTKFALPMTAKQTVITVAKTKD